MAPEPPSKPVSAVWKGKAKATEADFDDLNPVITYRHLHSRNLGVKDPLRVVALCDSDAFYAACEQVRLGIDPLLPLVVQQWDSLIAVNYPARKFGITRMEKIKEARKKCPELVVVHVATYREGEKEPGYWENPDTLTHKVCRVALAALKTVVSPLSLYQIDTQNRFVFTVFEGFIGSLSA